MELSREKSVLKPSVFLCLLISAFFSFCPFIYSFFFLLQSPFLSFIIALKHTYWEAHRDPDRSAVDGYYKRASLRAHHISEVQFSYSIMRNSMHINSIWLHPAKDTLPLSVSVSNTSVRTWQSQGVLWIQLRNGKMRATVLILLPPVYIVVADTVEIK